MGVLVLSGLGFFFVSLEDDPEVGRAVVPTEGSLARLDSLGRHHLIKLCAI